MHVLEKCSNQSYNESIKFQKDVSILCATEICIRGHSGK